MNINDYVAHFGNKSFTSFPLNDVDFLMFSQFSYININLLCSSLKEDTEPTKIKNFLVDDLDALVDGSVDIKSNKKLIKLLTKSKRYNEFYLE